MRVYFGKSVSGGIAIGKIQVYGKGETSVKQTRVEDTAAEINRCRQAAAQAMAQLEALYEKALQEVGENDAAIFEIHKMILEDSCYQESVENIIRSQRVNAEYAVARTRDIFAQRLALAGEEPFAGRVADIRDASGHLLSALVGREVGHLLSALEGEEAGHLRSVLAEEGAGKPPSVLPWGEREYLLSGFQGEKSGEANTSKGEQVILVAEDLMPSETVQLDKGKVSAFVTVHGSVNSHTAILARTMGIPAVVGTNLIPDETMDGKLGIVDGTGGILYVEPDEETYARLREMQQKGAGQRAFLQTLKEKETITLDGQRILLYANIGNIKELEAALKNGAEGIGLFRSEWIYLGQKDFPTEEEQFGIYRTAAEAMGDKRVIIRTLDIGADKQCDYFNMEKEENPALGCRGIRVSLARPEIFKTQLRALFRASAFGKIAILYPMIASVWEIRRIREIAEEVKKELTEQGIACGMPEQGIMIETPAAAIISDQLAKEADFFSIGTNDLTQYLLAADRQNTAMDAYYDAHHPAVLRMIELTVKNAHRAGIRVGICGELGADPALTRDFLAMGVDELSMAPERILPLRKMIRETDASAIRSGKRRRNAFMSMTV